MQGVCTNKASSYQELSWRELSCQVFRWLVKKAKMKVTIKTLITKLWLYKQETKNGSSPLFRFITQSSVRKSKGRRVGEGHLTVVGAEREEREVLKTESVKKSVF